jgi:hypothetical protein
MIPIKDNKKTPLKDWKTKLTENHKVKKYAILTGEKSEITVIDLDIKKDSDKKEMIDGVKWFKKEFIKFPETFTVKSPSGGYHLYFKYDEEIEHRANLVVEDRRIKIDGRNDKSYIIGPYSEGYEIINDIDIIELPKEIKEKMVEKPNDKLVKAVTRNIKPNNLTKYLNVLKSDYYEQYNNWISIGMIIKNTLGDTEEGLETWKAFSKQSEKYSEDQCESKWTSFSNCGKLKIGTLLMYVKDSDIEMFYDLLKSEEEHLKENEKDKEIASDYLKYKDFEELQKFLRRTHYFIFNNGNPFWMCNGNNKDGFFYNQMKSLYCYQKVNLKITDGITINVKDYMERNTHQFMYNEIEFRPYNILNQEKINGKGTRKILNTFTGFDFQETENRENVKAILNHIKEVLANGNEEVYNYIIKWLASIIQYPNRKTEVAMCFVGKQGCGKNIILDWIGEQLFGKYYCYINEFDKLIDKFNRQLENKLFTVLDEVQNYGNAIKSNEKLKSIITRKRITIEPKGLESYETRDLNNFIFLSNNENIVKIEEGDRRYMYTNCGDKYVKDYEYFQNLSEILNGETAEEFYNYLLKDVSLDKFNIRIFPETKERESLRELHLPIMTQFIREIQERIRETNVERYEVEYDTYKEYCEENGIRKIENSVWFGREMRKKYENGRRMSSGERVRYFIVPKSE